MSQSQSQSSSLSITYLACPYQCYDWGKLGLSSEVSQLAAANGAAGLDQTKPYAELWMGTHPTAPSTVKGSSQLLRDLLGSDLPFLFKVLSIRRALSIQAHPDLQLAPKLHANNPKEYRDANHKPELACAITPFEAMCGFRPAEELLFFLDSVPELSGLVGSNRIEAFRQAVNGDQTAQKAALREVFTAVMSAAASEFGPRLRALVDRIRAGSLTDPRPNDKRQPRELDVFALVSRLYSEYPDDIGVFAPFLLNCFSCIPGEAIFLAANEPHAYLAGDIVEVMACSDNVVRAGLTPKFRDVDILCSMLNYGMGAPPVSNGLATADGGMDFPAPVPEFRLNRQQIKPGNEAHPLPAKSHSIALVYSGSGSIVESSSGRSLAVQRGTILLIPANIKYSLNANAAAEDLIVFRCSANDEFKSS